MPTDLRTLDLFSGCTEADLAVITRALTGERHVREGEVICAEDEVADRWWIVVEGQADVTWQGIYLSTVMAGESIGELALLDGQPRTATVTATTDMVVEELDGADFVAALLEVPHVAVGLLRQFATRLRNSDRRPMLPASRPQPAAPRPAAVDVAHPRQLDPRAPGFFDDPYPQLTALREQGAVHWSDAINSWVITRYADVHRLSRAMPEPLSPTTSAS